MDIFDVLKEQVKCIIIVTHCKRQVICWIENHFKKIDNYIEN